jgi:hypothetical protein
MFQPMTYEIGKTDTLYHCLKGHYIVPSDSTYMFYLRETWEEELDGFFYLQFVLMDKDIHLQYYTEPCDTIRKYVPILHRYQLTLGDLQRMNWTIVYPPEE